jgi:outer membrane protein assembly factor BamE (lipoprotein component of BamABCDE complex)
MHAPPMAAAVLLVVVAAAGRVAGAEWKQADDAPAQVERSRDWAALTPGMTKGQVRGILGEPQQVEVHEGVDIWIYRGDGPRMAGRVTFREGLLETSGP